MTGYPQFNFPAFHSAAAALRAKDMLIVSPAELDTVNDVADKAMASETGDLIDAGIKETWGDLLARDVKLIADGCDGIIFLDGWEKSRGARLEAFVGVLCDLEFYLFTQGGVHEITRTEVILEIYDATI
jgi:hypothetical protein